MGVVLIFDEVGEFVLIGIASRGECGCRDTPGLGETPDDPIVGNTVGIGVRV